MNSPQSADEHTPMNGMPPQSAAETNRLLRVVSSVGYVSDFDMRRLRVEEPDECDVNSPAGSVVPACLRGEYTDRRFVNEKRNLVELFMLVESALLESEASPAAAADSHTGESSSGPFVQSDEIHLDYWADRFLRNGFTYDRLWEVDSKKWDVFSYFIASRDSDAKVENSWLEPRLCDALHDYIAAREPPGAVFRPMLHDTVPQPDSASIGIYDCLKACGVPTELHTEYSNSLKGDDDNNCTEVQNLQQMMECSAMTMHSLVRFANWRPLYALRLLKLTDEMRRRYGLDDLQSNQSESGAVFGDLHDSNSSFDLCCIAEHEPIEENEA